MKDTPPTLTRRLMARRLKEMHPDFPRELIEAALKEIISVTAGALSEGRPVTLRGFGRFQPRRYEGGSKRLGLLFRPSPELVSRLNKSPAADAEPDPADS